MLAQQQTLSTIPHLSISPSRLARVRPEPGKSMVLPGEAKRTWNVDAKTRVAQGARLRQRRKELGMSTTFVANEIGMSEHWYPHYEKCLPKIENIEREARLEELLQVPRGWIRNTQLQAGAPQIFVSANIGLATVAQEMRELAVWGVRKNVANRTRRFEELTETEQARARVLLMRYGLIDGRVHTYRAISNQLGQSEKWLYKLARTMGARIRAAATTLPAMQLLMQKVHASADSGARDLEKRYARILGDKMTLKAAGLFAEEVLGLQPPFEHIK